MKHLLTLIMVVACGFVLAGCSNSNTGPASDTFVVKGTLQNPSGLTLPSTLKVAAFWVSPDQAYIYGLGTVNASNATFSVNVPASLDSKAFLEYNTSANPSEAVAAGFALIVAIDDPSNRFTQGTIVTPEDPGLKVLGGVSNHAIVYRKGTREAIEASTMGWFANFPDGLSMGKAVYTSDKDGYLEPVPNSSFTLMIDSSGDSLEFPQFW